MSDFPVLGYLENANRTTGEMKAAFEAWLAACKQLPGGSAMSNLTIAAGVITPTKACHVVDTEGAAATDDLTNIVQTNMPDGSLAILSSAAVGRTVVLKHAAGGAGQMTLQGSVDFPLAHPLSVIMLRRDGATWVEVNRNTSLAPVMAGHIFGLGMSNAVGDLTNDILMAIGEAGSDVSGNARVLLIADIALTKRIDAVWAAGDGGGGRISSESLVDGTWHMYVFRRSGGVTDACFSQSLTPTLPDSGTYKRRIGSFIRAAGVIRPFFQKGDLFQWMSPALDLDVTAPGTTAVLRTLTVPGGLKMQALMNVGFSNSVSTQLSGIYFSDPDITDEPASMTAAPLVSLGGTLTTTAVAGPFGQVTCFTDTSSRVRSRAQASSASITLKIATFGWYDRRGKDF